MELYDVMRTTFAVREFTDDPLPDPVLYRILDNARFAPSGGNRQGTHIVAVRDATVRQHLAALAVPAARRYFAQSAAGENPWNPVAPSGVPAATIAATTVPDEFTAPFRRAAVVLVITVDLTCVAAMDQHLDRIGVVSGASVYPLVWNILLAARNEGYGGTLTTMAVPEEAQIRDLLGIPDTHAVAALLPLGKPVKQLSKLRRATVEDSPPGAGSMGPPPTRRVNNPKPSRVTEIRMPEMSAVPSRKARLAHAAKHAELWNAGKREEWIASWRTIAPARFACSTPWAPRRSSASTPRRATLSTCSSPFSRSR